MTRARWGLPVKEDLLGLPVKEDLLGLPVKGDLLGRRVTPARPAQLARVALCPHSMGAST